MKWALLCALLTMVIAGCVAAGVIALAHEPEPLCGVHSGLHEWTCCETTFNLLIDGDSVKFFRKIFTSREIELLKTKNSDSVKTTYQIFIDIDEKTRK